MGNKSSGGLSKDDIAELSENTKYTHEEISSMLEMFREDHPKSSDITFEEFKKYFALRLGDGPILEGLFKEFDRDNSGTLDFKELIMAFSMVETGSAEEKLEMMFKLYDEDNSGTITTDEAAQIMQELLKTAENQGKDVNSADAKSIMKQLDENGDGEITLEEWVSQGMENSILLRLLSIDA